MLVNGKLKHCFTACIIFIFKKSFSRSCTHCNEGIFFFSVLDCLTSLGTHLQQVYILDSTLQYALRDYAKYQDQIRFEPFDSELALKLKTASRKMLTDIKDIRRESQVMRELLVKVRLETIPNALLIVQENYRIIRIIL